MAVRMNICEKRQEVRGYAIHLSSRWRGLSEILRARPVSLLAHETFAEHDGELGPCLSPFARCPFPVFRSMVENKIQQFQRGVISGEVPPSRLLKKSVFDAL
jgi:hypothetical protein